MPRDIQLATDATASTTTVERVGSSARTALLFRWVLGALAFAWYTAFSLRAEALHYGGYDLGIFDQAVAKLAHFQAPVSEIKGFNLFGDHFHPIIAVIAPFYRVFPHASTLLVAQAAALAFSVVIVTKLMQDVFGARWGIAVGFAYSISWGLQTALIFAFHEVSLGVPIIAAAAARYLRKEWAAGTRWALLLLLVKEDMPFTVSAFGLYLLIHKQYKHGAALIAGAIGWFFIVVLVIIPQLNPFGRYLYWPGEQPYVVTPGQSVDGFDFGGIWAHQKLVTTILVLAPMLFLALRSWLALLLVPTLAWRFLSPNPNYWGTKYHYSEMLMPITFLAGAAGAAAIRWPPAARKAVMRVIAAGTVVVALAIGYGFPFWQTARQGFWGPCGRCVAADAALSQIPDGTTVTADDTLLPALVDRDTAYVLEPGLVNRARQPLRAEYVIVDTRHTSQFGAPHWLDDLRAGVLANQYTQIFSKDGYIVYVRTSAG